MHDENTCPYCVGERKRIEKLQDQARDLELKISLSTNPVEIKELEKRLKAVEKECGEAIENLDRHQTSANTVQ
jgi:hypothetical protein